MNSGAGFFARSSGGARVVETAEYWLRVSIVVTVIYRLPLPFLYRGFTGSASASESMVTEYCQLT